MGKPINWLTSVDERAAILPRAAHWLEYPYFLFARYPDLQPAPVSQPKYRKIDFQSGRRVFEQALIKWEERLATHDKASRCLDKLSAEQRRQLAALISDCIANFEWYELYVKHRDELSAITREADRRIRQVRKKIKKAGDALEEAIKYGSELDPLLSSEFTLAAKKRLKELLAEDEDSLIRSLPPSTFWKGALDHLPQFHPVRENPTTTAMVQVFWFFKHDCKLSGHESEVRVALIRNSFWTAWTKPVKYLPFYDGADSQGCTAVRKAVSRFSLN
jgi:hypothetical protein